MRLILALLLSLSMPLFSEITTLQSGTSALKGEKEEIDTIDHFPHAFYQKCTVAGLGTFYIDARVDIIKNELRAGRIWEPEIVALLREHIKPGSVAVDIGSHIGTHALSMSHFVGDGGEAIAFEPQKKLFAELVMNMRLNGRNNVTAYRAAVGEAAATIELNTPVMDNEGGIGIGKGGESAPMITLDSLNLKNVSLMKIDVENLEYSVLKGAEETIRRNMPYMIIEIMGNIYKPIDNREEQVQRTLRFLKEMGYHLQYIEGSWSDWLAIPPPKETLSKTSGKPTLAIFTYKVHGQAPWDPDSVKEGITGSEESVIYMAEELANLGYEVTVFGYPKADSPYSAVGANPRYIDCESDPFSRFDIGISWRVAHIGKELKTRCGKVYLWPHDTIHYTITEEQAESFDDVLWLSRYQKEQWASINPSFTHFEKIFGNGINPKHFHNVQERKNPYSCIYSSNYARGLELLLDIWPEVKKEFPLATLDIYYGWQHWGLLTPQVEAKMRGQIEMLEPLGVKEHGKVGHEELCRAFERTSFWTYPCLSPEVFAITALKAQKCGALPVIIQGSALFETVPHGYQCKDSSEYLSLLLKAMKEAPSVTVDDRKEMGNFVMERYTWEVVAKKWQALFKSL